MGQLAAAQTVAAQVIPATIVVDNAFENTLLDPNARFNIVVEVQAFAKQALQPTFGYMADMTFAGQVLPPDPTPVAPPIPQAVLLRFSSRPLNWRWDDQIAPNGYAEVRLATRSNIESTVNISPTSEYGGVLNVGSVIIDDGDRYLGPYIRDYTFIGRQARILWGVADGPRKDYRVLITAYVQKVERNKSGKVVLRLQDQRFRLDEPFQTRIFDGAGTIPGTFEQFGRKRPRCIGYRRHVEPPIVDHATGLRMINDGPIFGVQEAYFGGEPAIDAGDYANLAALYNAVVPEGGYATCNSLGVAWPRPAAGYTGPFTVAVQGDMTFGYTEEVGQLIVNEFRRAGINSFEINQSAFSFMDMSGGYWYDGSSELTIREVVENLALSGGGRISSDLQFTAIRLTPPDIQNYEDAFIDEEVEDLELVGAVSLPVVKFLMYYAQNNRVLSANEVVLPGSNPLLKQDLQTEWFFEELSDPLTPYRYSSFISLVEKYSLLNTQSDVLTVLGSLKDFFSVERNLWQARLPARVMRRNVGAILRIESSREVEFMGGSNVILVANNRQLEGVHSIVHMIK